MSAEPMQINPDATGRKQVDVIIVGLGISGLFLSYFLKKAGQSIVVFDNNKPLTATKIASGIINPVTGRRIVRTWRIEELLPFALSAYTEISNLMGVEVVQSTSLLDFHASLQMKEAFEKRLADTYLTRVEDDSWKNYFNYHFGIGAVEPCLLVDLNTMLTTFRNLLAGSGELVEEEFNWNDCHLEPGQVHYKHFQAKNIISCEGATGSENPYFKNLPFALNKGEAVIADIPGLPPNICKQGLTIVPWNNHFWVGSSYEWNFTNNHPTAGFLQHVKRQLDLWLKLKYEVVDHFAAVRPANIERRPFVGLHPAHPQVGILNGMGTKGCSLAPFFANQLANAMVHNGVIDAEANVARFTKVLARS